MPNPAPPTSKAVVLGLETAYTIAGEGPAIIMLHGWGANRGLVWPLGEKLADNGFRVIIPDLPGFGDTPPPPIAWTVHDYANFVLAFMDELSVAKAHVFGHSFGGRISIVLSANHADRFEKVVLCDAAGVKSKTPWHRQLPVTLYRSVEGIVGEVGMVQKLRDRYRSRVGSADYLNAGPLKETFLAVIEEDLLPYAPKMSHPTLLVWGDKDEDTPLWQAKTLEDAIPDAGLVVFKGAGHYSYLDALPNALHVIDYFFTHDA